MGIQEQMLEFIRKWIWERWIKVNGKNHITEQTDRLGSTSITLFLVAVIGILGELEIRVNRSLFVDDLALYITTKN